MGSSNRVALRYIQEVTKGVTPATPALKPVRFTSESLNYAIENTQTAESAADRTQKDLVQVSAMAAGDINFELSYGTFDDWLEAVFGNTWTLQSGDIFNLDNGTTMTSWAIQKHFQDMSPAQFHNFNGCHFQGMSLRMEVGRIVEGTFNISGFGAAATTTQYTSATFPAATTTTPMNAVSNLQNFSIAGVPYTGCVSSVNLSMQNNFRPRRCVGNLKPTDMTEGQLEVTGSMEFYFTEATNYANFLAGSQFSVSWDLVDAAGNKYTFTIPRAKFETGQVVAGGLDTDVMFSATFRGLYDTVTGRVIRLTRDPA
jgi:hypothetical protein